MRIFLLSIMVLGLVLNKKAHSLESVVEQSTHSSYPQHLVKMLDLSYTFIPDNSVNRFATKLAETAYGMSVENCIAKRASIKEKMNKVFYNLYQEQGERIPHLTHRIWITGRKNPHEAPQESLTLYFESLKKLSTSSWQHHFWCIKKAEIPKTIEVLEKVGIQTHELKEIYPLMKGKHIFDAFYATDQFCLASDIARQNIVYLYGGIYSDLGTLFLQDLAPFANAYHYMFWFNGIALDQCFFGYKKNDRICEIFLNNLENIATFSEETKALTPIADKQMTWGGGGHFMALFDVFSQAEDRFLLIPEGDHSLFQINHNRSWLKKGRFGNKPISHSQLDIFKIPSPFVYKQKLKVRKHH